MDTPDEIDLMAFFEAEPVTIEAKDGFHCYQHVDRNKPISIEFSFNIFEKSVQTKLFYNNEIVQTVSAESACKISIIHEALVVRFEDDAGSLELKLKPEISVTWGFLSI